MRDYLEYLRIPYLHQGRTDRGSDCFGLLRLYYKQELGIELSDFTEDYPQDWWTSKNYFTDLYATYGFEKVVHPRTHDLVMFKNTATAVGHVGIILDDSNFLHMELSGCGIGNYLYGIWHRQLHSFYSFTR